MQLLVEHIFADLPAHLNLATEWMIHERLSEIAKGTDDPYAAIARIALADQTTAVSYWSVDGHGDACVCICEDVGWDE